MGRRFAIDIHSHVVPREFPRYAGLSQQPNWPSMAARCGCSRRAMLIDGATFRSFDANAWSVDDRIEMMHAAGLDQQVISPLPELLSYWLSVDDGDALCRYVNDVIGDMVCRAPRHFIGFGGVALQNPDGAVRELERIMATGLFHGVEIGTNVGGILIGDDRFEPVFAAAEMLGAAIFIHPERSIGRDRLQGPGILGNLVAHPCETALAVTSLITSGTLGRHPKLRIAVAHGGGAFPAILPRLEYGWRTTAGLAEAIGPSPTAQARTLYWDNLVYDAAMTDFLIDRFGASQICLGTDFPAALQEGVPLATLQHLEPAIIDMICSANADRFLGRSASLPPEPI